MKERERQEKNNFKIHIMNWGPRWVDDGRKGPKAILKALPNSMPVGSKREIIICRAKRTLFTRIRPGKGVTVTAKQKYVKQLGLIPRKKIWSGN